MKSFFRRMFRRKKPQPSTPENTTVTESEDFEENAFENDAVDFPADEVGFQLRTLWDAWCSEAETAGQPTTPEDTMNRGSSRFSAFARYYVDHLGELTSGEKNPSILRNMSGFLPLEVVKGVAEIFETFAEQFYSITLNPSFVEEDILGGSWKPLDFADVVRLVAEMSRFKRIFYLFREAADGNVFQSLFTITRRCNEMLQMVVDHHSCLFEAQISNAGVQFIGDTLFRCFQVVAYYLDIDFQSVENSSALRNVISSSSSKEDDKVIRFLSSIGIFSLVVPTLGDIRSITSIRSWPIFEELNFLLVLIVGRIVWHDMNSTTQEDKFGAWGGWRVLVGSLGWPAKFGQFLPLSLPENSFVVSEKSVSFGSIQRMVEAEVDLQRLILETITAYVSAKEPGASRFQTIESLGFGRRLKCFLLMCGHFCVHPISSQELEAFLEVVEEIHPMPRVEYNPYRASLESKGVTPSESMMSGGQIGGHMIGVPMCPGNPLLRRVFAPVNELADLAFNYLQSAVSSPGGTNPVHYLSNCINIGSQSAVETIRQGFGSMGSSTGSVLSRQLREAGAASLKVPSRRMSTIKQESPMLGATSFVSTRGTEGVEESQSSGSYVGTSMMTSAPIIIGERGSVPPVAGDGSAGSSSPRSPRDGSRRRSGSSGSASGAVGRSPSKDTGRMPTHEKDPSGSGSPSLRGIHSQSERGDWSRKNFLDFSNSIEENISVVDALFSVMRTQHPPESVFEEHARERMRKIPEMQLHMLSLYIKMAQMDEKWSRYRCMEAPLLEVLFSELMFFLDEPLTYPSTVGSVGDMSSSYSSSGRQSTEPEASDGDSECGLAADPIVEPLVPGASSRVVSSEPGVAKSRVCVACSPHLGTQWDIDAVAFAEMNSSPSEEPLSLVTLECGDTFHESCLKRLLEAKLEKSHMTNMKCPCCGSEISEKSAAQALSSIYVSRVHNLQNLEVVFEEPPPSLRPQLHRVLRVIILHFLQDMGSRPEVPLEAVFQKLRSILIHHQENNQCIQEISFLIWHILQSGIPSRFTTFVDSGLLQAACQCVAFLQDKLLRNDKYNSMSVADLAALSPGGDLMELDARNALLAILALCDQSLETLCSTHFTDLLIVLTRDASLVDFAITMVSHILGGGPQRHRSPRDGGSSQLSSAPASSSSYPSTPFSGTAVSSRTIPSLGDTHMKSMCESLGREFERMASNLDHGAFTRLLRILRLLCDQLVLSSDRGSIKSAFVTCGAHKSLFSLVMISKEELVGAGLDPEVLCVEVFKTIQALIVDAVECERVFRSDIGYFMLSDVVHRLCTSKTGAPSDRIMCALFEMLVCGDFNIQELRSKAYSIKNPRMIGVLMEAVRHAPHGYLVNFLTDFESVIRCSLRNRSCCADQDLVLDILDLLDVDQDKDLAERCFSIIHTVGSHSISVPQCKHLFKFLRRHSQEKNFSMLHLALDKVMLMCARRGPGAFFDFDGMNSGLKLPPFEGWPSKSGYSISVWFRVEGVEDPLMMPNYQPRLLSFIGRQGEGMELKLELGSSSEHVSLSLRVLQGGSAARPLEVSIMEVMVKEWHHMVLVHSPRGFMSKSKLTVYLDGGASTRTLEAPYPKFKKGAMLDSCMIGSNEEVNMGDMLRPNPMHGQMGAFYAFDGVLSEPQVKTIYQLGGDYNLSFCEHDALWLSQSNVKASDFAEHLGNSLPRLMLGYNSKAHTKRPSRVRGSQGQQKDIYCLDIAVEAAERLQPLDALCLPGTFLCSTSDIRDVISSMGGIQILFPLVIQIDVPTAITGSASGSSSNSLLGAGVRDVQQSITGVSVIPRNADALLETLLCLIRDMLKMHRDNQNEMLRCQGFQVLGFLLKQMSPETMTEDIVNALYMLLGSISQNSELYKDGIGALLLDLGLWVNAPDSAQFKLFGRFVDALQPDSDRRDDQSTRRVMGEAIRTLWSMERIIRLVFIHYREPQSASILSSSVSTLSEIRSKLYEVADLIATTPHFRCADLNTLLGNLARSVHESRERRDENSRLYVLELLTLLRSILSKDRGLACSSARFVCESGGVFLLSSVLRHWSRDIRVQVLKILRLLFSLIDESRPPPNIPNIKDVSHFSWLYQILRVYPLDVDTYRALWQLALLEAANLGTGIEQSDVMYTIRIPGVLKVLFELVQDSAHQRIQHLELEQRKIDAEQSSSNSLCGEEESDSDCRNSPPGQPGRHPFQRADSHDLRAMIPSLLDLDADGPPTLATEDPHLIMPHAPSSEFEDLRQQLFADTKLVLENPVNASILHHVDGWQRWLLMVCFFESKDLSEKDPLLQLLSSILRQVLFHCITTVHNGWHALRTTMNHVIQFGDRGILVDQLFLRSLFISLLSDFCHPPSASGRTPTGFGGGSSSSSSTSSSSKRKKGSNNHFLERDISTVSDPKLLMNNMVHMIILIEEFLFYARVSMPDLAAQDAGVDVSGTSINSERGVILSRSRNMTLMPRPVQVEDLPIVCQLLEIMDNFFGGKLLTTSDFSTLQGVDCKSSYLSPLCIDQDRRQEQEVPRFPQGGSLRVSVRLIRQCMDVATGITDNKDQVLQLLQLCECFLMKILEKDHETEMERDRFNLLWQVLGDLFEGEEFRNRTFLILNFVQRAAVLLYSHHPEASEVCVRIMRKTLGWMQGSLDHFFASNEKLRKPFFLLPESPLHKSRKEKLGELTFEHLESSLCKNDVRFYTEVIAEQTEKIEKNYGQFLGERRCKEIVELEHSKKMDERNSVMFTQDFLRLQVTEEILEREEANMNNFRSELKEEERMASRQWIKIFRDASNERGAWGDKENEEEIFWKLQKTEDAQRKRRKLERDYNGSDRKEADNSYTDGAAETADSAASAAPGKSARTPDFANVERILGRAAASRLRACMDPEDQLAKEEAEEAEEMKDIDCNEEGGVGAGASGVGAETSTGSAGGPSSVTSPQVRRGSISGPSRTEARFSGKEIMSIQCEMIKPMKSKPGKLIIRQESLTFLPEDTAASKTYHWPMDALISLMTRRYRLRKSALEFFFMDGSSYFLEFPPKRWRQVYKTIYKTRPRNFKPTSSVGFPEKELARSKLTQRWQQREISNFEYLMELNAYAGRTYNDINQYPVFPWILADYTSEDLDLENPDTFRDLSRPIGALNDKRLAGFLDRYECMLEMGEQNPFLYGSHYSNGGIVLYYLIRLEPFTSYAIELQGSEGKFDRPDRLFDSIGRTWENVQTGPSDYKELIPEFFYLPEFLCNINRLHLGVKQSTGMRLHHVGLPPWCHGSPDLFVKIHRDALECDFVSSQLHNWIDLVFGCKQRGQAAVDAHNVFHPLTYEGGVDIESVPVEERPAIIAQIDNFGQTPVQLFRRSHPRRNNIEDIWRPFFHRMPCLKVGDTMPVVRPRDAHNSQMTPCFVSFMDDSNILVIGNSHEYSILSVVVHRDGRLSLTDRFSGSQGRQIPNLSGIRISRTRLAVYRDLLFTSGHWDGSFKIFNVKEGTPVVSMWRHNDRVTCIDVSENGKLAVTGSKDTTLAIWELNLRSRNVLRSDPLHILHGHDNEVRCVAICSHLDFVVSGSRDATCNLHRLSDGVLLRSYSPPKARCIDLVAVSCHGYFVAHCKRSRLLFVYSINNHEFPLFTRQLESSLSSMEVTRSGTHIVTLHRRSHLPTVYDLFSLEALDTTSLLSAPFGNLQNPLNRRPLVTSVACTASELVLALATEHGSVVLASATSLSSSGADSLATSSSSSVAAAGSFSASSSTNTASALSSSARAHKYGTSPALLGFHPPPSGGTPMGAGFSTYSSKSLDGTASRHLAHTTVVGSGSVVMDSSSSSTPARESEEGRQALEPEEFAPPPMVSSNTMPALSQTTSSFRENEDSLPPPHHHNLS